MFDTDYILYLVIFAAFAGVMIVALAIALILSWLGMKSPALWTISVGLVLACAASRYVRRQS